MKYYSLHGIVRIKTNVEIPIPSYFRVRKIKIPDMEILREELNVSRPREAQRCRTFFYWKEGVTLFIDYNAPFLNAKLVIDDLKGKTKIKFTKALKRFARVEIPIKAILSLKLIQKGHALLHGGCLNHKGQSILLIAPRDIGKTSTILSLLDGKDFKFMSDDLTIVSKNGKAYSYPERVNIYPYTLTGNLISPYGYKNPIKRKLSKSHFLILLFWRFFNKEFSEGREIPQKFIGDKGRIKKVFFLAGGKEDIERINREEAVKKILASTLDLINPTKVHLLNFYSYFFSFDIQNLLAKEKEIVERAIKNAECFELRVNNLKMYPEMIKKVLKSESA